MMSLPSGSVLKAPGVQVRTLRVPNSEDAAQSGLDDWGGGREQASKLLNLARQEAQRLLHLAQEEANRLRGQAQVELGRAQAEAEARLAEAGEVITSAAEARRLLAESKAQADEILSGAEAEVAAALAAARDEGLAEGLRTGREQATQQVRQELQAQIELVFKVAAQAKVDREQLLAEAEPAIIRLGVAVAHKVIAREVQSDPDILRGLLTRTMLKAAGGDRIRLRLNPATIERLGDYLTNMTSRFADRGVDVVADRSVEVAGVVIETRSGAVDGSVETQLNKIERSMLALTGE